MLDPMATSSLIAASAAKDSHTLSAAYLALALREARRWFLETQADTYGDDEIRWSLNLGIPSAGYDDKRIRAEFEAVAHAAWALSLEGEPPSLDHSRGVTEGKLAAQGSLGDHRDNAGIPIAVIPEVTAQVLGYGKSHERQMGLHVLIDVGASTFDISGFILHVHGEVDRYPMLTGDTARLGLLMLQLGRMKAVGQRAPLDHVPSDIIGPIPEWKGTVTDVAMTRRLAQYDNDFLEHWIRTLNRTLRDLRQRRDPNSPRWKDGLPVFGCGGGSGSPLFEEFVQRADRRFREWATVAGLRLRRLPVPNLLVPGGEPLESEVFSRLGVAYGLSYDAINIPETEPPREIEDISELPQARDYRERYVDKDQV